MRPPKKGTKYTSSNSDSVSVIMIIKIIPTIAVVKKKIISSVKKFSSYYAPPINNPIFKLKFFRSIAKVLFTNLFSPHPLY